MTEIQTIDGRSLKPLLQKLNPIWWFQNDDEQQVSDAPWHHPEWPQWRREFYWRMIAYVRETEAPTVHIGQAISFTVLAYPDQPFYAKLSYVAAALDPNTRRLLVRATVNNAAGLLKLEMFASVTILTSEGDTAVAVPGEAIIHEGGTARVWRAVKDSNALERRRIKTGLTSGNMVEVVEGLAPTDRVITRGSLFIDRLAAAAGS